MLKGNIIMKKVAFIISNIEEYGKLIAFCIRNDICVFRTYWDEREKGDRCYSIDWKEKDAFILLGFITKIMTMRYYLRFLKPMSMVIIGGVKIE